MVSGWYFAEDERDVRIGRTAVGAFQVKRFWGDAADLATWG